MMKFGSPRGFDGTHEIYGLEEGELKTVYDGGLVTHIENIDGGYYYSPSDLAMSVEDRNGDGYNDIILRGNQVEYSSDSGEETSSPVEFVLTYDNATGSFKDDL